MSMGLLAPWDVSRISSGWLEAGAGGGQEPRADALQGSGRLAYGKVCSRPT